MPVCAARWNSWSRLLLRDLARLENKNKQVLRWECPWLIKVKPQYRRGWPGLRGATYPQSGSSSSSWGHDQAPRLIRSENGMRFLLLLYGVAWKDFLLLLTVAGGRYGGVVGRYLLWYFFDWLFALLLAEVRCNSSREFVVIEYILCRVWNFCRAKFGASMTLILSMEVHSIRSLNRLDPH